MKPGLGFASGQGSSWGCPHALQSAHAVDTDLAAPSSSSRGGINRPILLHEESKASTDKMAFKRW